MPLSFETSWSVGMADVELDTRARLNHPRHPPLIVTVSRRCGGRTIKVGRCDSGPRSNTSSRPQWQLYSAMTPCALDSQ